MGAVLHLLKHHFQGASTLVSCILHGEYLEYSEIPIGSLSCVSPKFFLHLWSSCSNKTMQELELFYKC